MRIKLSEKYKEQRDNICNKLITILNLDSNNTFLLCDLDNDLEKQKQIIDMKEDIQNVFACSTIYEILCCTTSYIIVITSTYILIKTNNYIIIFIILAGTTSYFTRLYRIIKQEYVMDHPIVYSDIFFAILAFGSFIFNPFDLRVYYPVVGSFILMIIAAIMSWDIFPVNLVEESFYFQSAGHIIISTSLCYLLFIL